MENGLYAMVCCIAKHKRLSRKADFPRQTPFRERDQPRPSPAPGSAGVMHILSSLWGTSVLLFCTLSSPSVWALHESEAGVVDWQRTFIGVPRTDAPKVAPRFLRVKVKNDETTSLVVSATETALGAVNPVDGNIGECGLKRAFRSWACLSGRLTQLIAWRHIFEPSDPILGYYKSGNGELGKYTVSCLLSLRTFWAVIQSLRRFLESVVPCFMYLTPSRVR